MIVADLKDIGFNGISSKLEAQLIMCEPEYYIPLCLSIGKKGDIGADYFYVDVFNIQYAKKSRFLACSKCFIVSDDIDDIDDIEKEIKYFVNSIHGKDWEDVLNQLRRYFDWEYENHKFVE
ncbi:hypothetical protein BKK52_12110 [Rodentibacter trehalosifermentans]|uniref:Immunity protein 8 n=1 Tax=Rodentibacter trehalosifermentans TaxID=1908263 RepID=A0A1V3IUQ3_9PAST|nr:Imm8 family immunity protein [Rodentibacter trehalosifermentans]OOF45780.1 hypothetical protein BKK52_12110 [Rodentibacter trehalosifermentans]